MAGASPAPSGSTLVPTSSQAAAFLLQHCPSQAMLTAHGCLVLPLPFAAAQAWRRSWRHRSWRRRGWRSPLPLRPHCHHRCPLPSNPRPRPPVPSSPAAESAPTVAAPSQTEAGVAGSPVSNSGGGSSSSSGSSSSGMSTGAGVGMAVGIAAAIVGECYGALFLQTVALQCVCSRLQAHSPAPCAFCCAAPQLTCEPCFPLVPPCRSGRRGRVLLSAQAQGSGSGRGCCLRQARWQGRSRGRQRGWGIIIGTVQQRGAGAWPVEQLEPGTHVHCILPVHLRHGRVHEE